VEEQGSLGGGQEGGESAGEAPEAGASALAMAAALQEAQADPQLAARLERYVERQTRLTELQLRHFDEERRLAIAAARRRRYAERIRNTISTAVLIALALALLGAFWMVSDARGSRQVVVSPFDVAPGIARESVSGRMLAAGVLDELVRIQAATRSSAERTRITNAWEGEIRIDVPETGLSIGEAMRVLRDRLGHDVRIEGDLAIVPAGLALTVRGTGIPPRTFTGKSGELDRLVREAAEYAFGQSRPALWAAYLVGAGRLDDAVAFARQALPSAAAADRARLLDMWAISLAMQGGFDQGLVLVRAAVEANPEDWGARVDIPDFLAVLGREEEAWKEGEEMRRLAGGRPGRAREILYQPWDNATWNHAEALEALRADLAASGGMGSNFGPQWVNLALHQVLLHDVEGAEMTLVTTPENPRDPVESTAREWVLAMAASERGDALSSVQHWRKALPGVNAPLFLAALLPGGACFAAPALEIAGLHADADRALASVGGRRLVDCERFRAELLERRGDRKGAIEAYADAIRLAPDLPAGYYSWGLAQARAGDLEGAQKSFREANRRGPHWADPLKSWGDALVQLGRRREAMAKYDEALKFAPHWKALREAREAAGGHTS